MSAADKQTEIRFYHLERSALDNVLPRLLEKTLETGQRALVQTQTVERKRALSEYLWLWRDNSFLPHASGEDESLAAHVAYQPIWLTDMAENPNNADILFLVDGAQREDFSDFSRCFVIFDGRDNEALTAARRYWADLKDSHALTYWQETQEGWEQKS